MVMFVHSNRLLPIGLIFPLFLLFLCVFNDSNPLDPDGNNYKRPLFTIDTIDDNIGDADTIHRTSARLVVVGNHKACLFQVKVDNRDSTEWQSDGAFLLKSLTNGSHDVIVKCKYDGGKEIVADTIHFVALTDGYVPKFINYNDSQVYTDTGKTVILHAAVTGPGPFTYQWYKDSTLLDGETDSVLVIDSVTVDLTGIYYYIVANEYDTIMGPLLTVAIVGDEKIFSIIYHDNGSIGGMVPSDGAFYGNGDTATVRTNTGKLWKEGFEFTGWCRDSLCSTRSYVGGDSIIIGTENVHLFAKWEPRTTFTVTYKGNGHSGGEVPVDTKSYLPGENVTVKSNVNGLVKDGFVFSGWNSQEDGLGNPYSGGYEIANISKDIVLYARWTKDKAYVVVYNGNGNTSGDVPDSLREYPPNTTIVVLDNIKGLEKTGYRFVGWNTASNGNGINYYPDVKLTLTSNVILYAKWTQRDVYSITYDGNENTGGSAPSDNNKYESGQKIVVKANTGNLVRDGYTFAGWNTRADGSGSTYMADVGITVADSNIVLYARWTQNETYTVVYNGNGNTTGNVPVDVNNYELHDIVLIKANDNSLRKEGYRFTGWCSDKDGNGKHYAPQDSIPVLGNIVLYAVWTQVLAFNVIYDGNGNTSGSVPVDSILYNVGSLVIVRANTNGLVKDGFTFAGWNTMQDGSGKTLYANDKLSMDSSNMTLYAYWTQKETFSVTYDPNGSTDGIVPVDSNNYESGALVSVMSNSGNLVKSGYTFTGWNTNADGSGNQYAVGTTFSISENTTLYARWSTKRTYTVSYQGNGNSTGYIPVDNNAYESGGTAIVPGNVGSLQKDGFIFTGWNENADGTGASYSPNAEIKIDTQNVVLYAAWIKNTALTYRLTYYGNEATSGSVPADNTLYKENSAAVIMGSMGSLLRIGYSFAGWCRSSYDPDHTLKTYMPGDTIIMSDNIALYAVWTTDQLYAVIYSANGSTNGAVPKDENLYLPGVNVTVKDNSGSLVRNGYTFIGWNTKADGSGDSYNSSAVFVKGEGDDTLYAKWSAKPTYSVTYNSNNATWGSVPSDANTYEEGTLVTLKSNSGNLVRNGYTFKGWNTSADGNGTAYPAGGTMSMPGKNITLYADWNIIVAFTVTYNGNGSSSGTVPFDQTSYTQGATVVVKGNTGNLVRDFYNFTGWSTSADGNGAFFIGGMSFPMGNANVTLYAKWTQNPTYRVYYNANGASYGSTPTDYTNYSQGQSVSISGNIGGLVRTGYTFVGWATNSSGTGTIYNQGNTITMGASVINLFAVWKPVTYFVVFDDQSATTRVSPDSMAVAFPDTCLKTLPSAPAKTGYLFGGWYTSKNGTGSPFTATTRVSGRMTVFANWLPYTKVIYNGNGNTSGTVPSDTGKYLNGAVAKVKSNSNLVKTGYTFANWNSAKDGTGKFYAANDEIVVGKDTVVLYATWRATVLFDDQGATVPPDPASVSLYFPDTLIKKLPSDPSRIGHTFTGWYTAVSGGTKFTAATKVTGSDTVYAQWSVNRYTLTYNGNSNTGGTEPSASTHNYNTSATAASPGTLVRTGYKFKEWNTAESGKGVSVAPGGSVLVTSDMTLWAQWVPIESFTIMFDKNSTTATGSMSLQSIESGTSAALTLNAYKYAGYSFSGWATSADGKVVYADGDDYTMGISNDTLYAVWIPNASHKVNFNNNSETAAGTMTAQSIVEGVSAALSMNTYTNPGYSFSGWAITDKGAVAYADGANYTMGSSDVTLYAIWTQNASHTITFDKNSPTADGKTESQTIEEGLSKALTLNGFSNAGYSFAGWSTTSDETFEYTDGASYTMGSSDVTLYAIWTQNASHTITFDKNDESAEGEMKAQTIEDGLSAALTKNAFKKTGYTFYGWSETSGGTVKYDDGANYKMETSDDTLYAVWSKNVHVVKFVDESGTGTMPNQSITEGDSAPLTKITFTKSGYSFAGWSTTSGGTVEFKDGENYLMGTSDVELFAIWTENPIEEP